MRVEQNNAAKALVRQRINEEIFKIEADINELKAKLVEVAPKLNKNRSETSQPFFQ